MIPLGCRGRVFCKQGGRKKGVQGSFRLPSPSPPREAPPHNALPGESAQTVRFIEEDLAAKDWGKHRSGVFPVQENLPAARGGSQAPFGEGPLPGDKKGSPPSRCIGVLSFCTVSLRYKAPTATSDSVRSSKNSASSQRIKLNYGYFCRFGIIL